LTRHLRLGGWPKNNHTHGFTFEEQKEPLNKRELYFKMLKKNIENLVFIKNPYIKKIVEIFCEAFFDLKKIIFLRHPVLI
jgi:hypothetical protein